MLDHVLQLSSLMQHILKGRVYKFCSRPIQEGPECRRDPGSAQYHHGWPHIPGTSQGAAFRNEQAMKWLHSYYFHVNPSVPLALFLAEDVIPKFDSYYCGNICDPWVTIIQCLILFTEKITMIKSVLFWIMCAY
jgi:hypothetical protein